MKITKAAKPGYLKQPTLLLAAPILALPLSGPALLKGKGLYPAPGQISKLLARLEDHGRLQNTGVSTLSRLVPRAPRFGNLPRRQPLFRRLTTNPRSRAQQRGRVVMRLKRSHVGVRVCALMSFVVLAAAALAASPALALTNPERHYEMVSPPFKDGYGVSAGPILAATGGEALAFSSQGSFVGQPANNALVGYISRRGTDGWATEPILAPGSVIAGPLANDLTPSLGRVVQLGTAGPNSQRSSETEGNVALHETGLPDRPEFWNVAGILTHAYSYEKGGVEGYIYESGSASLCQVLLSTTGAYGDALLPEAVGLYTELYQVGLGCDGESNGVKLVGVNNQSHLIHGGCVTGRGGHYYAPGVTDFSNSVSSDGGEVFFTTCTKEVGSPEGPSVPHQVFVRLGGVRTVEVSRPVGEGCRGGGVADEVPCQGAEQRASADFGGASEDGSYVYFTAGLADPAEPLVPGEGDASTNLYVARIGCPGGVSCSVGERVVTSLVQASHDPALGGVAGVLGVVSVSPDGSRAYFVARGDLLAAAQERALEEAGRPLPLAGGANLYEFDDTDGSVAFIGSLCTGALISANAEDVRCPSEKSDALLWGNSIEQEAQTGGPHGEYLVFATRAQLTSGDTNTVRDIYRYDSLTGMLTRVSIGENGFADNGNANVPPTNGEEPGSKLPYALGAGGDTHLYEQHRMISRAISEDGSRIVFTSAAPLSSYATSGLANAYEWHEGLGGGRVSLISGGSSEQPVKFSQLMMSPSGQDVFFVTTQRLLSQDTDEALDVYDARLGAGFPAASASVQPCSGDACQGPLTNPAPLLVPGSVSQAPGENLGSPPATVASKPKPKSKQCKKGFVKKKNKCIKTAKAKKASRDRRTKS